MKIAEKQILRCAQNDRMYTAYGVAKATPFQNASTPTAKQR
jgi:hypothetical protein